MWLVLAEPDDPAALWAYLGLRDLGLDPLEVVTMDELVTAPEWWHRLDDEGVSSRVRLHDDRVLDAAALGGVLNRARDPGSPIEEGAAAPFAAQEVRALIVSWLESLPCPVLNPPTPACLYGRNHDRLGWQLLALECGLAVEPGQLGDEPPHAHELLTVVMLNGEAHGHEMAARELDGLRTLARKNGTPILQAWFQPTTPRPRFVTATPLGELRLIGESGLETLRRGLEGQWPG